jgi:hypothetical protein
MRSHALANFMNATEAHGLVPRDDGYSIAEMHTILLEQIIAAPEGAFLIVPMGPMLDEARRMAMGLSRRDIAEHVRTPLFMANHYHGKDAHFVLAVHTTQSDEHIPPPALVDYKRGLQYLRERGRLHSYQPQEKAA